MAGNKNIRRRINTPRRTRENFDYLNKEFIKLDSGQRELQSSLKQLTLDIFQAYSKNGYRNDKNLRLLQQFRFLKKLADGNGMLQQVLTRNKERFLDAVSDVFLEAVSSDDAKKALDAALKGGGAAQKKALKDIQADVAAIVAELVDEYRKSTRPQKPDDGERAAQSLAKSILDSTFTSLASEYVKRRNLKATQAKPAATPAPKAAVPAPRAQAPFGPKMPNVVAQIQRAVSTKAASAQGTDAVKSASPLPIRLGTNLGAKRYVKARKYSLPWRMLRVQRHLMATRMRDGIRKRIGTVRGGILKLSGFGEKDLLTRLYNHARAQAYANRGKKGFRPSLSTFAATGAMLTMPIVGAGLFMWNAGKAAVTGLAKLGWNLTKFIGNSVLKIGKAVTKPIWRGVKAMLSNPATAYLLGYAVGMIWKKTHELFSPMMSVVGDMSGQMSALAESFFSQLGELKFKFSLTTLKKLTATLKNAAFSIENSDLGKLMYRMYDAFIGNAGKYITGVAVGAGLWSLGKGLLKHMIFKSPSPLIMSMLGKLFTHPVGWAILAVGLGALAGYGLYKGIRQMKKDEKERARKQFHDFIGVDAKLKSKPLGYSTSRLAGTHMPSGVVKMIERRKAKVPAKADLAQTPYGMMLRDLGADREERQKMAKFDELRRFVEEEQGNLDDEFRRIKAIMANRYKVDVDANGQDRAYQKFFENLESFGPNYGVVLPDGKTVGRLSELMSLNPDSVVDAVRFRERYLLERQAALRELSDTSADRLGGDFDPKKSYMERLRGILDANGNIVADRAAVNNDERKKLNAAIKNLQEHAQANERVKGHWTQNARMMELAKVGSEMNTLYASRSGGYFGGSNVATASQRQMVSGHNDAQAFMGLLYTYANSPSSVAIRMESAKSEKLVDIAVMLFRAKRTQDEMSKKNERFVKWLQDRQTTEGVNSFIRKVLCGKEVSEAFVNLLDGFHKLLTRNGCEYIYVPTGEAGSKEFLTFSVGGTNVLPHSSISFSYKKIETVISFKDIENDAWATTVTTTNYFAQRAMDADAIKNVRESFRSYNDGNKPQEARNAYATITRRLTASNGSHVLVIVRKEGEDKLVIWRPSPSKVKIGENDVYLHDTKDNGDIVHYTKWTTDGAVKLSYIFQEIAKSLADFFMSIFRGLLEDFKEDEMTQAFMQTPDGATAAEAVHATGNERTLAELASAAGAFALASANVTKNAAGGVLEAVGSTPVMSNEERERINRQTADYVKRLTSSQEANGTLKAKKACDRAQGEIDTMLSAMQGRQTVTDATGGQSKAVARAVKDARAQKEKLDGKGKRPSGPM